MRSLFRQYRCGETSLAAEDGSAITEVPLYRTSELGTE